MPPIDGLILVSSAGVTLPDKYCDGLLQGMSPSILGFTKKRISCQFYPIEKKKENALSDLQIVSFWAEKNARTIEVKRLGIEFSGVTKRLITSALIFSHPELKDWPTVSR